MPETLPGRVIYLLELLCCSDQARKSHTLVDLWADLWLLCAVAAGLLRCAISALHCAARFWNALCVPDAAPRCDRVCSRSECWKLTSMSHFRGALTSEAQSTQHRAHSTERTAYSTAHIAQHSIEHRAHSTQSTQHTAHRAQSTECTARSTEHRAHSPEHTAQSTQPIAPSL
jgi:hypothetical protein